MPKFSNPQEEVKWLEEQLEAKKKEVMESGESRREKEMAKEVVEEHAQKAVASDDYQIPEEEIEKHKSEIEKESHSKQVEQLLHIANEKGIINAIAVARKLNNPHLLDDFHDRIVWETLKIS